MRRLFTALLLCLCLTMSVWAQKVITGKVTDPQGNPVPNVSVTIKGTKTGTITKEDGTYSITLPSNSSVIVISSVGYASQEISAGDRSNVSVTIVPAAGSMEEVVVVAYGTQKRESITGSVAKIGAEQLETRLTTNITQALAGAAPGISTTSGNGQPGSSAAIRIRGFGSVNASSSPLYVVDGFPYEGYIGDLNTNDIESITLLKDASSTALYGARAANGVVVITTKRGKTGAPKVNLMVNTGFSQRGIPEYDRVGAYDYYPLIWQGIKNSLMYPASGTGLSEAAASLQATNTVTSQLIYNPFGVPDNEVVGVDGKLNPNARLQYNDFDWYAPMEQNGFRKEAAFNISSKLNKTDYFFSLNYLKDDGFIIKSDYERVTARMALNTQIKDWLRAGVNMSGVFVGSRQSSGDGSNTFINPFVFARGMGPIYPVHAWTKTGEPILDAFGNQWFDYGIHPGAVNRPSGASPGRHIYYETMLNNSLDRRNSLIGRTFMEAKFLKYFTFTTNLGVDLNNVRTYRFQNKVVGDGVTGGGTASRTANEYRTISLNQLLNYSQRFGGVHSVSVLAGHETQRVDEDYFNGSRRGMNLDGNEELANFVTLAGVNGQRDFLRREAYLSRVNYSYDNKYYLDLSYRRDASSRFSPQSRWGNFYSVGASWSIMREKFMASASNWLSDLKIRAAYGTVGNDGLDSYYEYQALYSLGWNNAAEPGALFSTLSNPNLTWEVNKTASLGIDFGFFKNRITGSVELFSRGSSELLFDVPLGPSSIVTSQVANIGAMNNKGIELQLGVDVVRAKDFNWKVDLNFTTLKNKITKLPDGNPITNGTKRLAEGQDIYAFYLRQWYGVDAEDGAGLWYAAPGTTTSIRISGKGDSLTTDPNNARFGYSGSAIPKFFGAITNTVSYKGFTLSFLLNYQIGGKFYDGNYAGLMAISYGGSMHTDAMRAWKKPGDVTDVPRLDISRTSIFNTQSNRWLIDASYLNMRNITLAYSLPREVVSKLHLDQAKIYVGGENLFILTKRKGMNPAESFTGTNSPVYVPNRLFNAGINVTF